MLSGASTQGSALIFEIDAGPANGTLGDLNGDTLTYFPAGNFSGTDTFKYVAIDTDASGLPTTVGLPATVTISVNPVVLAPGVTITESGGTTHLDEEGRPQVFSGPADAEPSATESDSYTVVLNSAPTANVVVSADANSQLQVSPSILSFTPINWSVPQALMVLAPDDDIAQPDHSVTITHSATSADSTYDNISVPSVSVAVIDSNFTGIFADAGDNPVDLNEQGPTSADISISLSSKPAADVTVSLSPDAYVSLSATSLTFTSGNWDTAQSVTVTAVHDGVAQGYHAGVVTMTAASSDASYQGLSDSFSVNILDADSPNALPDDVGTDQATALTFNVLGNDVDPLGYLLSVSGVTQPAHGTVAINTDWSLTYTPNGSWADADPFTYSISNGQGGSTTGSVSVSVGAVNHPPSVTNPGSQTSQTDTAISLQIQATDPDSPEGASFLYRATNLPPGLVISPMTGKIWGWIDPHGVASYDTSVTVDDFVDGVTTVNFTWTVTQKNHPPIMSKSGHGMTYKDDYFEYGGIGAWDVDGDTPTFTVAGLPPGVTYNASQNLVSGAPTAAGTYTISVTADDGHGGTDEDSFFWYVLEPFTSIPFADVQFGEGPGQPGETEGVALHQPATPDQAFVYLVNPSDPNATYTVTVDTTPGGLSSLSQSSFQLRDGEFATFDVYPNAISQKRGDGTVRAFVAGRETGRVAFTNVGVVLPEDHIEGKDTPEGFVDRVSTGDGNWGTYYGEMQVYPNLYGLNAVTLAVQSPNSEPKYGAAAAVNPQIAVLTNSVITIEGAAETEAILDANGEPTDDTSNDEKLSLAARLAGNPNPLAQIVAAATFGVKNIPIAVKAKYLAELKGEHVGNQVGGVAYKPNPNWVWGVIYHITYVPDGLSLGADIWQTEVIEKKNAKLSFRNSPKPLVGDWDNANSANLTDTNGEEIPAQATHAQAVRSMRVFFAKGGSVENHQYMRWSKGKKPADGDHRAGQAVRKSGFIIEENIGKNPLSLIVQRFAKPALQAPEAGLLDGEAAGAKHTLPF